MHSDRPVICQRCGKARQVPIFPLRCSCGLQTNEDGSTVSLRNHGLGDLVANWLSAIGITKRKGCGCTKRQQALNRLGDKATDCIRRVAMWLHPR